MTDDSTALLLAQRRLARLSGDVLAPLYWSRAHDATDKLGRSLAPLTTEELTKPHLNAVTATFPDGSLHDITVAELASYTIVIASTLRASLEMLRDRLVLDATVDADDAASPQDD